MERVLIALLLTLTFSCGGHLKPGPGPEIPPQVSLPAPTPEVQPTPIPQAPGPYLVSLGCTNCTETQSTRIAEAVVKLNEVTQTQCFKDGVLAYQFLSGWTLNRSNQEILASLMGAGVTIEFETYYTLKRVLGYTVPNQNKIWINRRTMLGWSVCDLASLIVHEGSHKIGYDHQFNYVQGREHTVPYALNTIFEACCSK